MTPDEFEFWQKAYMAALSGVCTSPNYYATTVCAEVAKSAANEAIRQYRTAKATVVQT